MLEVALVRTPPSSGLLMSVARGLWARLRRSFTEDSATPTPRRLPRPPAPSLTRGVGLSVTPCINVIQLLSAPSPSTESLLLSPRITLFTIYAPFTCNSLSPAAPLTFFFTGPQYVCARARE